MHILLTNDDGFHAPGLKALAAGMIAAGHRISVCAPDRERSGVSHSIAIQRPLTALPAAFPGAERAWAVDGSPADCASLGLWLTRDDPADLVIAGINYGMNLGGACVYSGTVGAAMEAAFCGAQALAVSLCVKGRSTAADFAPAARLAARVADWMTGHPLPQGCIYNLNVPPTPYREIKGLVPAKLAPVFLGAPEYVSEAEDRYRYQYTHPLKDELPDGDAGLIARGFATITKLTWDIRMNADDRELAEIGL